MRFWEAIKAIEDGHRVRRKHFDHLSPIGFREMVALLSRNCEDEIRSALGAEWEIYEELPKTYSFMEILPGLKEGKAYLRKGWAHPIHAYSTRGTIRFISNESDNSGQKHFFSIEDFEATDWVEVK